MDSRLLVLIALLMSSAGALAEPDPATVDPYILRVLTRHDQNKQPVSGTGFAIQGAQVLITNYHVIDDAKDIMVLKPRGKEDFLPARVLKVSKAHDIAVLAVAGLSGAGLLLSPRVEVDKGQPVWAIGYPGAADRGRIDANAAEASMTQGIVNRTLYQSWEDNDPVLAIVQHDAKLSHGNSGGPLLDACGQVVGVNTQIELAEQALETYNYALAVGELRDLLNGWGISYQNADTPCHKPARSSEQPLVWWIGLTGVLGIAALVLALQGSRERLARVVKSCGRNRRRISLARQQQPGRPQEVVAVGSAAKGSSAWATLTLQQGDKVLCVLRCPASQFQQWNIGRSTALCDQVIDDETVSRCHARLFWQPQYTRWYVEDLDSSNGTRLDGMALSAYEAVPVHQSAQLTLGELRLTVASEEKGVNSGKPP